MHLQMRFSKLKAEYSLLPSCHSDPNSPQDIAKDEDIHVGSHAVKW